MKSYREYNRSLGWGLDLGEPAVTTQEEIDEFRRVSAAQLGGQQLGLDFWLDEDPEVLKRYRIWANALRVPEPDEAPNKWSASGPAIMYVYAMTGFEDGLTYSFHNMMRTMTRAQILEQVALVFRYSGPRGMVPLARAFNAQTFPDEPPDPLVWPTGWGPDPEAFACGADFGSPEASADDTQKIVGWYEQLLGEVPRHVAILARHRPDLLKAHRQRYENTLRELPKQTEPWALLQISIERGFAGGIREGMLLGRAFGITKPQILEAISWGTFYGGNESLDLVAEAAGDVLDAWPD